MVIHGCKAQPSVDNDRKDLERRYKEAVKALNEKTARIAVNAVDL